MGNIVTRDRENNLDHWLRLTGTSNRWLAEEVGVSESTVARWCIGAAYVPARTFPLIKRALRKRKRELIACLKAAPEDVFAGVLIRDD